jgi:uncharacterized membrane protein
VAAAQAHETAPRRVLPRWVPITTFSLSLLAVGLTAYLTITHYTDPTALACPDTGIVNCTAVTTSSWSVIVGVPVALIGLLWAAAMAMLNSPWAWRSRVAWADPARLALSGAGALMVLYLVYVELFRVDAICLWCTGVHLTTIALFGVILAARASVRDRDAPRAPGSHDAPDAPASGSPVGPVTKGRDPAPAARHP